MSKHLGDQLRSRRRELGLTQRDVATRLGVTRPLVCSWERGRRSPPAERLEELERVLSVSLEGVRLDAPIAPERAFSHAPGTPSSASTPPWKRTLRARRRVRPPYPHAATLEQMLRLDVCAARVHEAAVRGLGPEACADVVARFPRDTRHELLVAFHVLSRGAHMVEAAPDHQKCPLFVLDDYEKVPGGAQYQPALFWRGKHESMLIYSQVRVLGAGRRPFRVDFLIHYRPARRHGAWITVEIDGPQHSLTPHQDADRAEGLGIPEVRYDNEATRRSDFFERFLCDVRRAARLASNWMRERRKNASKARIAREKEAAERCVR